MECGNTTSDVDCIQNMMIIILITVYKVWHYFTVIVKSYKLLLSKSLYTAIQLISNYSFS